MLTMLITRVIFLYIFLSDPESVAMATYVYKKGSAASLIGDVIIEKTAVTSTFIRCSALCSETDQCSHFQYHPQNKTCIMRCNGQSTTGESYIKQTL